VTRPESAANEQSSSVNPTAERDLALVRAVLHKDRKATAEFVARCADEVYSFVRSRLAPRYDGVDDLVQEAFLAAWKSLPQYRGVGSLGSWVIGIARHKVEDYYRQRLRAPESLDESDSDPPATGRVLDFHQVLARDQLRRQALRVMEDMPEHYRLALIWRYWEQASARDMATKTGKTEKAIERLLARARAEFRERWNRGQSA
jgi:RNA polymerase sigma-70 factor, ECF subfamily